MAFNPLSVAVSALLLAAFAGGQARTQAPPSAPAVADANAIVVTGSKATRPAIHDYIDDVTVDTNGQIAMFEAPICPASFGLPDAYNRIVERRLREDAARVGLSIAGERCDANVVVIVTNSPGPLIAALRGKRPDMFVGLEVSQIEDIVKTKAPVRTWQAIEPRGADGRPLERLMFINGMPASRNAWYNPGTIGSRLRASIRPRLVSSFIVVDADAADGLTLTQIADYAAMRTLARTRFASALGRRTILGFFDSGAQNRAIDQLTPWDLAYLSALYRTSNGVDAHAQHIAIATAMKRALDTP